MKSIRLLTYFFAITLSATLSAAPKDTQDFDLSALARKAIAIDQQSLAAYKLWLDEGHSGEFDYEAAMSVEAYALKTKLFETTDALALDALTKAAKAQEKTVAQFVRESGFKMLSDRMTQLTARLSDNSHSDEALYIEFMTIQGLLMYTGTSLYRTVDLSERAPILENYNVLASLVSNKLKIYC